MNSGNPNAKEKTTQECINTLELLFKSYRKDSRFNYQLDVCNSEFNIIKKKLKALDIIKKRRVDLDKLLFYIETGACDDSTLSWYNEYSVEFDNERTLTHEEYELLKEELL